MAIYNFNEPKQKNKNVDYQKIVGIIFVASSILCLFCLITHFVPFMKSFLLGTIGLFAYPLFITLMAVGFALIGHKKYVMPIKYAIYVGLSIVFVLCILQLLLVPNANLSFGQYLVRCYTKKTTAGGIILGLITAPVLYLLNRLGAYIIFIALSLIFIALTVDYIHYLTKNEKLKDTVKVTKPAINKNTITVKELESNLKKQSNNSKQEKVKLTLDAKMQEETAEEKAKRKLGLLLSSQKDQEDNSRYFEKQESVAKTSITNTREYLLTRDETIDLSKYSAKNNSSVKLNNIQANLMKLKNNETTDFEVVDTSMPSKVIHEENAIVTPAYTKSQKSTIGNIAQTDYSNNFIIEDKTLEEKIYENQSNNESNDIYNKLNNNEVIQSNIQEKFDTAKDEIYLNQKIDTMEIENFTNNVLKSLNQTNSLNQNINTTVNYTSSNKMFEQDTSIENQIQAITPKEPINYLKPPIDLLTTESMDLSLISQDVVMKREELEIALDTFGIPAKVIGVVIGPAVTRYELEMPAGVSIKRLLSLQEDIAYNLSSNGDIRIEAPIPGRRAVGIEVPNEKIATVGLKDIIMSPEFMSNKAGLSIALGKDISGSVKTFSLVKIPHLLIAGTTGSGKSVCINAIILSLIYKYSPDEVKFILIDPKRVEFSMYNNLPHLLMPNVITDSEKALNALSWCVDEMEKRFITFANARVKNMEEYNACEEVLEGKAEKLPYIIFIIDELADLLMTAKKEAEEYICRILQKARAAGIHMILATQRPSVDVVTGKIKANLNARICFALMTSADSKTVLDQGGADKLLGKGDMLFMSSDTGVPKRIQGCFVTTKEIDDVVTFIKENNGDYEFDLKTEQSILNPPKNDVVTQIDGDRASTDGFDALMPQVLKSVIDSGHASISMIQRKFLVGFPRAARIIDQMEEAGYISPSDGSKSRSVYITMEEYEKLYGDDEA